MPQHDISLLKAALVGYEQELLRIERAMADVRARLTGKAPRSKESAASVAPKRKLSKEATKRIAAAQKKRWAEYRRQKATQTNAEA